MRLLVLLPHLCLVASPKSLMNKGALFPGTTLPLANAPPFLSLLQSSTGGKGKQNTSFLFESTPCESSPSLTCPKAGEVLQVGQAQLREGLPACPTPGLGSALGEHSAVQAGTSTAGFLSSLPLLRATFLRTPSPRFFCRAQAGRYGSPGLLSCSSLLFGYIRCCHRPKAALPRSPSITSGCLSATGSGLCSCHSKKHKQPLFFLPTGGTRPSFPEAWPEPRCAWGAEQWGRTCLRCLVPAPQAAGDE